MCGIPIINENDDYHTATLASNARVFANDLPTCHHGCGVFSFNSGARRVYCQRCGFGMTLTAASSADYTNALLGLTPDLNLREFLRAVAGRVSNELNAHIAAMEADLAVSIAQSIVLLHKQHAAIAARRAA